MIGFDNDKYITLQSQKIKERIALIGGKLYMEFGGKLFDDYHASRVLPGFMPDSKLKMLCQLKDDVEIIVVINSRDIESNKVRSDIGVSYDLDVLRHIDAFRLVGLFVGGVVMTHYTAQPSAVAFCEHLQKMGIETYKHYIIDGYPMNLQLIVSENGFGKNDYIKTQHPLVVVTAPGASSGKMAVCLSQLYHDHVRGIKAGYAKFETFPIWNLPLKHPVNMAYEASTVDHNDVNMIDPFHLEAYGITTVNYNRDIDVFPVLSAMFKRIYGGESPYNSPTDMGVNMAGYCIYDEEAVQAASKAEIIRRYYNTMTAEHKGVSGYGNEQIYKCELLMQQANISVADRRTVAAALEKAEVTGAPAAAMELTDGKIITGKTSSLLGASSALLLNALKVLAELDDSVYLISPSVIEPIQKLKTEHLGNRNPRLHTDEILIALAICASTDENAKKALEQLPKLANCEVHSSVILSQVDEGVFKKLGVNLTTEPKYQTKKLYHK